MYKLNAASIEYLNKEGYNAKDCKLLLSSEGYYDLQKAPYDILSTFGNSGKKILDRKGKWTVNYDKSYNCLIELEGICVVPLTEREGRIAIPITIGDGDECKGVVFERAD